ncbi:MAG: VCBS repeat-containing protein [Saprospiraceae bacterium]
MKSSPLLLIFLAACFWTCGDTSNDRRFFPEPEAKSPANQSTRFELLSPESTGIQFVPDIKDEFRYNFMADPYIYNGGGVGVLDINNDGLQDLVFTARLQGCRVYLNKGNFHFEDISESSGVAQFEGLKTGVSVVDINGDGWQDFYVCRTWLKPESFRRNLLFVNNHDNTFSERAAEYHLDDLSASQHANFFDFDQDGDLDCYVINHPVDFASINTLDVSTSNARFAKPKNQWESDRLYQNENNVFTDITEKSGLLNRAFGLSSLAADFNGDGWLDLFVGNDFVMPDFLYLNNRNGTFTDLGDHYFKHTSDHTMGSDMADVNGDGLQDLITLDMLAAPLERQHRLMNTMQLSRDRQMRESGYGRQAMRNALQLNTGNTGFNDIACIAGMAATDWSWAPLLADYDNDGACDIFISNGIQRDLNDLDFFIYTADSINSTGGVSKSRFPDFNQYVSLMPSVPVNNVMFKNTSRLCFQDVSLDWGFGKKGFSNGAAYADLDNDGDLDIITNNLQEAPSIYKNEANRLNKNNWLQVKCSGTKNNPFGLGARVRIYSTSNGASDEQLIFAQQMTNIRGFYSSVEPIMQIGLGDINSIDKLEIDWQEGKFQVFQNIAANQRVTLTIQEASPGKCPPHKTKVSINFQESIQDSGLDFVHRENSFDDFDREKLLPYRMSASGPFVLAEDLNGDGLEDVCFGGAAGQAGAIYLQQKDGRFRQSEQMALEKDAGFEDTAASFLDADGDGDQDLYVVSGGNEAPIGSNLYQDRLYINDGKGNFLRSENLLPVETSPGACIKVFDYDKDGSPDILVGGHAVPGRYPEPARSFVLKNTQNGFIDVTKEVFPAIEKLGMVTSIETGDLSGDGHDELIICGEWMPIQIFKFKGSSFENVTAEFGLTNSTGLWRCLQVADIDKDGDLDILAGNIGLNTNWHASINAPLELFASDFDKNGSLDPILVMAENGVYKPVEQLGRLVSQIPPLKKKYNRNTPYSKASILDLFSKQELLSGIVLQAQHLESAAFINEQGTFKARPLPDFAQISTTEKLLMYDFDGDNLLDMLVLGNDYGMNMNTYQLDASEGYIFPGLANGLFAETPVSLANNAAARDAVLISQAGKKKLLIIANNNSLAKSIQFQKSD